jgi:hypothetical protein
MGKQIRYIVLRILNRGTRWVWLASRPCRVTLGKKPHFPLNKATDLVWMQWRIDKSLLISETETGRLLHNLVITVPML